jgi:hypothetical protein
MDLDHGLYYDRKGRPIGMLDWVRLVEDRDYSVIAQHWVRGWKVSTVWLGLNHNFTFKGAPVIFETMIFAPKDVTVGREDWEDGDDAFGTGVAGVVADLDKYQERYATEDAAQAGHDRALAAMVRQIGDDAAMDVISAAQFSDPPVVPDDLSGIE